MAISVDWGTKVISVPQSYLTPIGGSLYELDTDQFRLDLKDLEDSEAGIAFPSTHSHNTQVGLGGVTYARTIEIINGYTVTFESGSYRVRLAGSNNNIADVTNLNSVSILSQNSAGLIAVDSGAGDWTSAEKSQIRHRLGIDGAAAAPSAEASLAAKVWTQILESGFSAERILRILASVAAGKNGATENDFRNLSDTQDQVNGTVAGGKRTAATYGS